MAKAIGWCALGFAAGFATMFLVIMGLEMAGHALYPAPAGIDPGNTADVGAWLAVAPMGALVSLAIAWIAGAFAGGAVAGKVSRFWPRTAAIGVALVVVYGVVEMIRIAPHPQWLAILGLVLPVPAALLGAWLARPRRALPSL